PGRRRPPRRAPGQTRRPRARSGRRRRRARGRRRCSARPRTTGRPASPPCRSASPSSSTTRCCATCTSWWARGSARSASPRTGTLPLPPAPLCPKTPRPCSLRPHRCLQTH
ncbi:BTBD2 isoform 5, partial [Pan troglodytes]